MVLGQMGLGQMYQTHYFLLNMVSISYYLQETAPINDKIKSNSGIKMANATEYSNMKNIIY